MNEEKRVHPRFLFSEPVGYGQSEVTVNGSVAGNISLGGISLKIQEFVPLGTVLELQICLGSSPKVFWAKARVVRVREISSEGCYDIGLKFIKDEACLRAIGEYVLASRSKSTNQV